MKKMAMLVPIIYIFLALGLGQVALAQGGTVSYVPYDDGSGTYDQGEGYLLTSEELDDLLAPIALYPDPLIAQILPAATFFDQVDEAARYVRQYGSAARVDEQPWDISVRAVAHYPDVLYMMDERQDWTVALGQAYIEQPQDVMDAIQRLRAAAEAEGNLYSTAQQQVVTSGDDIAIVPAQPEYIYVPVYDPQVVYVEPYDPSFAIISFSTPFIIGPWLNRDCDWHRHRVYYHGWRGGGWVGRSRPHVHDRRGIYTGRNARVIHTNGRILRRDTRGFRNQLRADTTRRLEQGRLPGANVPAATRPGRIDHGRPQRVPGARPGGAEHGRAPAATGSAQPRRTEPRRTAPTAPSVPGTTRPPATAPAAPLAPGATAPRAERPSSGSTGRTAPINRRPIARRPGAAPAATPSTTPPSGATSTPSATPRDVYRGRDVQKSQPASQSGYGGYGTGRDATIYRERGQSSRHNMQRVPGTTPRSTVTPRQTAPTPTAPPASRSIVTPAPAAPRSVPVAPRTMTTPGAPRSVAPAPAPRSIAPAAPVHSAPMSAPSAPRTAPAAPAGVPGGMMPHR